MIRSVIVRVSPDDRDSRLVPYQHFVSDYLHKRHSTVITFNYDEILENLRLNGGYYGWQDHVTKRQTGIPLLKLHGSIGWDISNPIIIPPTWSKSLRDGDVAKKIVPLWQLAGEAVGNADRIVFIGYSLPSTDQYFRQFLAMALAKSRRIQEVIVINPDQKVNARFKLLLNEHFRRSYSFFDLEFEFAFGRKAGQGEQELRRMECKALLAIGN
jgi:hypothetical protein